MTFLELQNYVMDQLNYSSTEARTRVKSRLNLRYREVQSSVNLADTRRGLTTFPVVSGSPTTTQSGIAKVLSVFDSTYLMQPLAQMSLNQLRVIDAPEIVVGVPYEYVVNNFLNNVVTLRLFPVPTVTYDLQADVLLAGVNMVDDADEPAFPTDYHDILVHGALADELNKMEKYKPAQVELGMFQARLAELRYFILKSAWINGPRQTDRFLGFGLSAKLWPYTNFMVNP